jgi:hypothetical protein
MKSCQQRIRDRNSQSTDDSAAASGDFLEALHDILLEVIMVSTLHNKNIIKSAKLSSSSH